MSVKWMTLPWPLASLPAGEAALARHLLCDAREEVPEALVATWADYYGTGAGGIYTVCRLLKFEKAGDAWHAGLKNAAVVEVIKKKSPRFALLNGREDLSHTQVRLAQEAPKLGITLDCFDLHDFTVRNDQLDGPASVKQFSQYAAIFVTAPEPLAADAAPVDRFVYQVWAFVDRAGAPVIPSWQADWLARDKMKAIACLRVKGIPTPDTCTTTSIAGALQFVKECRRRGHPTVVKPLGKGGGWAVTRVPVDWPENRVLDLLGKFKWWYGAGLLHMQEFVPNAGHDKRVLVLGDIVLGVEDRLAGPAGESWIYNISKGGSGRAGAVTPAELQVARRAASATGQFFAGIDLLPGADGQSYVLEVNSNPGFSGFEQYVGCNVGAALLRYVALFGASRGTPPPFP